MKNDLDDAVNDILSQLQQNTALARTPLPEDELDKEQLEAFIIKTSGKLINKTITIIDDVQDYIRGAPDAKDVAAFAELLKAASSSIEALNKVYISIEKNKNVKEVKKMDIDAKERMNTQDNTTTLLLSRKEIMQGLLEQSNEASKKVIDV